jgi:hypothetical protein
MRSSSAGDVADADDGAAFGLALAAGPAGVAAFSNVEDGCVERGAVVSGSAGAASGRALSGASLEADAGCDCEMGAVAVLRRAFHMNVPATPASATTPAATATIVAVVRGGSACGAAVAAEAIAVSAVSSSASTVRPHLHVITRVGTRRAHDGHRQLRACSPFTLKRIGRCARRPHI